MTSFRFLHISDLHIAETPDATGLKELFTGLMLNMHTRVATFATHDSAMLRGLARYVYENGNTFDGIIITGDLATTGTVRDLRTAHTFVGGPSDPALHWLTPSGLATIGDNLNPPVYLLPGNHDRYRDVFFTPGGTNFDSIFGQEWPAGQGANLLDVRQRGQGFLALIGADLTLRSWTDAVPLGNIGQMLGAGRAYSDVTDELIRITKDVQQRYTPVMVVWLIHFPPKYPSIRSSSQLLYEQLLIDAAAASDVDVLLCGHTHEEEDYLIPGTSARVLCAGTATQHRPRSSQQPRTIHILDFSIGEAGGGTVIRQTLAWSAHETVWK